jgi:hypothetical protein
MDDFDNLFGDEACDAFVSGLKFDQLDEGTKQEFARSLIEDE